MSIMQTLLLKNCYWCSLHRSSRRIIV